MMRGQFEAFGHRKAFCERQVREGIGAGAAQILVLGAGYDTLGWWLAPEFKSVNFFEIDHPATAGRIKSDSRTAAASRGT
jgi:O-methyltransferase involved in polyketide biosynthesis